MRSGLGKSMELGRSYWLQVGVVSSFTRLSTMERSNILLVCVELGQNHRTSHTLDY